MTQSAYRTSSKSVTDDHLGAIGGILIQQGRLSASEADEIERFANGSNLRFGEAGIRLNRFTQEDVDSAVAQQFGYPVLSPDTDGGVGREVVAACNPRCAQVESLRAIRSMISFRWVQNGGQKIAVIASPARKDGRSWFAANLAVVFAQVGLRTLLVDADMRNPRQHDIYQLSNEHGLSALLTGRAGLDAACRIHPQMELYVLPAGLPPPNPNELLARPGFNVVLRTFAEQFDVVLLDAPAVTETSDAQLIAAQAGGALMLARRHKTRKHDLVDTVKSLEHSGATIIGCVLNEF